VSVSGGISNLQKYYAISSNLGATYSSDQTSNVFSNLPAGTSYIIRVEEDVTACVKTYGPVTLAKSAVTTTLTPSHLTCYNQNSDGIYPGSVSIAYPSGGNGAPYQYKLGSGGTYTDWPAGTTAVWGNLRGGVKTVYIRDAQNCEFTFTTTVNEPSQVTAVVLDSNPACSNGLGSLTVSSISGGSGSGYQVKLGSGGTYENFSTSKVYSSLGNGSYTIYVKDSSGCENSYTNTITIPSEVTASTSSYSYPSCWNSTNGQIIVSAGGGTGSYTYSINNGSSYQLSATFSNLPNDNYNIRVKDSNGCVSSLLYINLNTGIPNANLNVTNATCNGGTGSITTSGVSTTSTFYRYNAGVNFVNTSGTRKNVGENLYTLSAGSYSFRVYNFNETCYKDYTVTITQPTAQTASITNVVGATAANNDGSLTISSTGGVWNKTYTLYKDTASPYNDNPTDNLIATYTEVTSGSPSINVTGLACGYYWLQVSDANGCTINSTTVNVTCASVITLYQVNLRSGGIGDNGTYGSACYNYANGAMMDVTIYTETGYFEDGQIAYTDSSGNTRYSGSGGYYTDGSNSGRITSGFIRLRQSCTGGPPSNR
jgi:hypothetical protein